MLAARGCGGGGGGTYVVQGAIFLCSKRGGGGKNSFLPPPSPGREEEQSAAALTPPFPPTSDRVQSFVVEKREREKGLRGEGWEAKRGGGGHNHDGSRRLLPSPCKRGVCLQEMLLWATSSQETEAALEEEGFFGRRAPQKCTIHCCSYLLGALFFGRLPLKHACALCKEENAPFSHNLYFSLAWRESCNNAKLFLRRNRCKTFSFS